jgi:hypothetical protein
VLDADRRRDRGGPADAAVRARLRELAACAGASANAVCTSCSGGKGGVIEEALSGGAAPGPPPRRPQARACRAAPVGSEISGRDGETPLDRIEKHRQDDAGGNQGLYF